MDRRRTTARIAANVRGAITAAGASVPTVALAADITIPDLTDRLEGRVEFEIGELVNVGGFLRVPTNELLEV